MEIRTAKASDAGHLVRFINMAADDLPLHFWQRSVGPEGDPWVYGKERAARETGSFSYRNAWLAELNGDVAACLLGYPSEDAPGPLDPDTPAIFVPLLELEALAPGSWYLNVLATYDQFRGKGCGSALLDYAEDVARRAGHRSISLIAADTHQNALRLYAARGYREVARRSVVKGDWQVDAEEWILFAKSVDSDTSEP
ncbi:Ribosomal protein S18 acetylase RimI [Gemmobacter aquatilis]|uniref:Ribosomal protein S18 acetylase RimI n=1 Tax=Gemmobacter aquatilis TaxID=933059 RepID=A0A1H8MCE3_9RHOB|nr:GNAT family N-acetyltransferase [Gemmobacter aquatilis]SEO14964.1 Ribosomal protein S18 acetylase RimI [Gemmobacter aquatilis]